MKDARARSQYTYLRNRGPLKVISIITLWSFLLTTGGIDTLVGTAWAARTTPELTSVGSDRAGGLGNIKELNVKTFSLPQYLGHIRDSYDSGSGVTVIHIQDAHANYACQQKLAEIIDYFNREYGVSAVNLEGGAGDYDLGVFASIDSAETRDTVSDYFVKDGLVNGAEYFAINNPDKTSLWGVEDTKLYVDNLKVYRDSLKYKPAVEGYIKELSTILDNIKNKAYTKELLDLDRKYADYKDDRLDLKDYVLAIMKYGRGQAIDIKGYTNLYLMQQALEQEEKINFKTADAERSKLIDILQKSLPKKQLEELVTATLEYQTEKIPQNDFYTYLLKKAKAAEIDMEGMPELQKYIIYISLYQAIDKTKILEEMTALETRVKDGLFQNPEQRELDRLSKDLALTKNLFNISITRDDYKYYLANKAAFGAKNFKTFIDKEAPKYKVQAKLSKSVNDIDSYRDKIAEFYTYSFKRDDAFLKNMKLAQASPRGPPSKKMGVMVSGGFHTENLCDLYKKNNISYISIIPNFKTEEGYISPYFNLLSGKEPGLVTQLQRVMASSSTMMIASMETELGKEVWGKAGVDAFKVAVKIQEMLEKDGRVNLTLGGKTLLITQDETGVKITPATEIEEGVQSITLAKLKEEIAASTAKKAESVVPAATPLLVGAQAALQQKAQRPIVDCKVDAKRAQDWINAQPSPELRRLAEFIIKNITYVDQEQFEAALARGIAQFTVRNKREFVTCLLGPASKPGEMKSNGWTLQLAMEKGLPKPAGVIEGESSMQTAIATAQWLAENKNINDVMFIDDASYSGAQLDDWLTNLAMQISDTDALAGREITFHIIIPFMTAKSEDLLRSRAAFFKERGLNIKIEVSKSERISTVKEMVSTLSTKERNDLLASLDNTYGSSSSDKTLFYFQHKQPDYRSVVSPGPAKGTILEGPVINKDGSISYVQFIPIVGKAPYQNGYLEAVAEKINTTDWASRLVAPLSETPAVAAAKTPPSSGRGFSDQENIVYSDIIKRAFENDQFTQAGFDANGQIGASDLAAAQANGLIQALDLLRPQDRALLNDAKLLFINGLDQDVANEVAKRALAEGRAPPASCYGTHYGIQRNQYYIDAAHLNDPKELARQLTHELQERAAVMSGLTADEKNIVLNGDTRSPALVAKINSLSGKAHKSIVGEELAVAALPAQYAPTSTPTQSQDVRSQLKSALENYAPSFGTGYNAMIALVDSMDISVSAPQDQVYEAIGKTPDGKDFVYGTVELGSDRRIKVTLSRAFLSGLDGFAQDRGLSERQKNEYLMAYVLELIAKDAKKIGLNKEAFTAMQDAVRSFFKDQTLNINKDPALIGRLFAGTEKFVYYYSIGNFEGGLITKVLNAINLLKQKFRGHKNVEVKYGSSVDVLLEHLDRMDHVRAGRNEKELDTEDYNLLYRLISVDNPELIAQAMGAIVSIKRADYNRDTIERRTEEEGRKYSNWLTAKRTVLFIFGTAFVVSFSLFIMSLLPINAFASIGPYFINMPLLIYLPTGGILIALIATVANIESFMPFYNNFKRDALISGLISGDFQKLVDNRESGAVASFHNELGISGYDASYDKVLTVNPATLNVESATTIQAANDAAVQELLKSLRVAETGVLNDMSVTARGIWDNIMKRRDSIGGLTEDDAQMALQLVRKYTTEANMNNFALAELKAELAKDAGRKGERAEKALAKWKAYYDKGAFPSLNDDSRKLLEKAFAEKDMIASAAIFERALDAASAGKIKAIDGKNMLDLLKEAQAKIDIASDRIRRGVPFTGRTKNAREVRVQVWQRDPWVDLASSKEFYACCFLGGIADIDIFNFIRNKSVQMMDFYHPSSVKDDVEGWVRGKNTEDKEGGRKVRAMMAASFRVINGEKKPVLLVFDVEGRKSGIFGSEDQDNEFIRRQIEEYAQANGFTAVAYNGNVFNAKPKSFIEYLGKQSGSNEKKSDLKAVKGLKLNLTTRLAGLNLETFGYPNNQLLRLLKTTLGMISWGATGGSMFGFLVDVSSRAPPAKVAEPALAAKPVQEPGKIDIKDLRSKMGREGFRGFQFIANNIGALIASSVKEDKEITKADILAILTPKWDTTKVGPLDDAALTKLRLDAFVTFLTAYATEKKAAVATITPTAAATMTEISQRAEEAGRGADNLPNDTYTSMIRLALRGGKFSSCILEGGKFIDKGVTLDADLGPGKGIGQVISGAAMTEAQLAILNSVIDKAELKGMAEGLTIIFIKGQKAHYAVGRGQIYLDSGLLEPSKIKELTDKLVHELKERNDVIDGLGKPFQDQLAGTLKNPKARSKALNDKIDSLALQSHRELVQFTKYLNSLNLSDDKYLTMMGSFARGEQVMISEEDGQFIEMVPKKDLQNIAEQAGYKGKIGNSLRAEIAGVGRHAIAFSLTDPAVEEGTIPVVIKIFQDTVRGKKESPEDALKRQMGSEDFNTAIGNAENMGQDLLAGFTILKSATGKPIIIQAKAKDTILNEIEAETDNKAEKSKEKVEALMVEAVKFLEELKAKGLYFISDKESNVLGNIGRMPDGSLKVLDFMNLTTMAPKATFENMIDMARAKAFLHQAEDMIMLVKGKPVPSNNDISVLGRMIDKLMEQSPSIAAEAEEVRAAAEFRHADEFIKRVELEKARLNVERVREKLAKSISPTEQNMKDLSKAIVVIQERDPDHLATAAAVLRDAERDIEEMAALGAEIASPDEAARRDKLAKDIDAIKDQDIAKHNPSIISDLNLPEVMRNRAARSGNENIKKAIEKAIAEFNMKGYVNRALDMFDISPQEFVSVESGLHGTNVGPNYGIHGNQLHENPLDPEKTAGGDWHSFAEFGNGRFAIMEIADVAGHGVQSAVIGCILDRVVKGFKYPLNGKMVTMTEAVEFYSSPGYKASREAAIKKLIEDYNAYLQIGIQQQYSKYGMAKTMRFITYNFVLVDNQEKQTYDVRSGGVPPLIITGKVPEDPVLEAKTIASNSRLSKEGKREDIDALLGNIVGSSAKVGSRPLGIMISKELRPLMDVDLLDPAQVALVVKGDSRSQPVVTDNVRAVVLASDNFAEAKDDKAATGAEMDAHKPDRLTVDGKNVFAEADDYYHAKLARLALAVVRGEISFEDMTKAIMSVEEHNADGSISRRSVPNADDATMVFYRIGEIAKAPVKEAIAMPAAPVSKEEQATKHLENAVIAMEEARKADTAMKKALFDAVVNKLVEAVSAEPTLGAHTPESMGDTAEMIARIWLELRNTPADIKKFHNNFVDKLFEALKNRVYETLDTKRTIYDRSSVPPGTYTTIVRLDDGEVVVSPLGIFGPESEGAVTLDTAGSSTTAKATIAPVDLTAIPGEIASLVANAKELMKSQNFNGALDALKKAFELDVKLGGASRISIGDLALFAADFSKRASSEQFESFQGFMNDFDLIYHGSWDSVFAGTWQLLKTGAVEAKPVTGAEYNEQYLYKAAIDKFYADNFKEGASADPISVMNAMKSMLEGFVKADISTADSVIRGIQTAISASTLNATDKAKLAISLTNAVQSKTLSGAWPNKLNIVVQFVPDGEMVSPATNAGSRAASTITKRYGVSTNSIVSSDADPIEKIKNLIRVRVKDAMNNAPTPKQSRSVMFVPKKLWDKYREAYKELAEEGEDLSRIKTVFIDTQGERPDVTTFITLGVKLCEYDRVKDKENETPDQDLLNLLAVVSSSTENPREILKKIFNKDFSLTIRKIDLGDIKAWKQAQDAVLMSL